jgi:hypothetical protein
MSGSRGRHRTRWALLAGLALGLLAPAAAVGATLRPTLIAPKTSPGATPDGFARTADGTLHVVYETNQAWGMTANGVGAVGISAAGTAGPQVQAFSWGTTGGSPNGIPGLALLPSGALAAVFPGSPSGDNGPWGIASTDGGATWSAPPLDVGSGTMESGGANTLQVSNGTPVLTEGCCGAVVVQQGLSAGAPTAQVTNNTDGSAGNVDSAVDAASGAVIASWDSNDGSGGRWLQQVAPAEGTAQKAPIPSAFGTGLPLIVAGRDSGPGVFAAYPADTSANTAIGLLRYGGGSVTVGSVKGLRANVVGDATGPKGRIWVFWYGTLNAEGVTAFTRSNEAVTRFEPIQQYTYTWSSILMMAGDGRLGPLDMLANATGAGSSPVGIYWARVLPELSAKVSAKRSGAGKFKLTATVTDAGDPVSGATVAVKGKRAQTSSAGVAHLAVSGSAGRRVSVAITAPSYLPLKASVKL